MDGTRGRKGRLASHFSDLPAWADAIVIAGSLSLYHRLADVIQGQRGLLVKGFVQALYPSSFLCGTGACLSCVADVAGGRRRVCLRGPVFDLADLMR
jgi:NAD(P)H-flavin reductase